MMRHCQALILVLLAVGCRSDTNSDSSASTDTTQAAAAARHTAADFQALRYVEGDWVGSGYSGGPFYESYRFVDDSTIEMTAWSDSTMATARETSQYLFRDGVISTSKGGRLVKVDDAGHHFQAPSYSWTFTRVSADRWTARVGPSTVYTMDRVVKR